MTRRLARYPRDPLAFIDDLVKRNELGQPFHLLEHQREILRLAFTFDNQGRLLYDTSGGGGQVLILHIRQLFGSHSPPLHMPGTTHLGTPWHASRPKRIRR